MDLGLLPRSNKHGIGIQRKNFEISEDTSILLFTHQWKNPDLRPKKLNLYFLKFS